MQTCSVCFESFSPLSKNVKLSCGHEVACSNCWRQYITATLEEGFSSHLQCMEPQCKAPVPLSEARNVLTDQRCDMLCCARASCCSSPPKCRLGKLRSNGCAVVSIRPFRVEPHLRAPTPAFYTWFVQACTLRCCTRDRDASALMILSPNYV